MKKKVLQSKTDEAVKETQAALQLIYDSLNHGQQKKLIKDEAVKALFDRYNIIYE